MQIILPKNVNKIIHVLEEHGFQAYAVGGCIRDSLLGTDAPRLGHHRPRPFRSR